MYQWISDKPYRHHKAWRTWYRKIDGVRAYKSWATEAEALAWIAANAGQVVKGGRPIEDVTASYLASPALATMKDSSRSTLKYRLASLYRGFERLPVEAFPWGRAWAQNVAPQSGDSQSGILAALQGLVAFAGLPAKVLAGLAVSKSKKTGKPQLRVSEAMKFVQAAVEAGDPLALAAATCLFTGLRPGEVMALQARDCDMGGALLWVERGKTARAKREVEVDPQWQPVLFRQAQGKAAGDLLFAYRVDRVRDQQNPGKARTDALLRRVRALCQEAGLPEVVSHSLRGLNATLRKLGGASDDSITRAVGHVSFATTARHYLAPGTRDKVEGRKAFGRLLPAATQQAGTA